ncbi:MAG TPA: hypothetical protein VFS40_13505 [Gemmatimonadales bacterium]|nr:hypothetical protein [Gemmatimonadales bacterium]
MVAPSLINSRRFPPALRPRLQVAYARAWEALAETHCAEAVRFVRLVAAHLPADEALQRYFREVGVPSPMQESVRARAVIALEEELEAAAERAASSPAATAAPVLDAWALLRPEQLVEAVKRRAQLVEETNLACQLAASLADEAVCVAHVRNAIAVARALSEALPLNEAIMHYIRAFDLPMVESQLVFQRALAQLAERHPILAPPRRAAERATERAVEAILEPTPRSRPTPLPTPAYGLRAIG